MLTQAIGGMLPAAIGVALSPVPIIAIVVVLGTPRARVNGPAFALGWVVGLAAVGTLVVLIAGGADDPDSASSTGVKWLNVVVGVVFLVMAAQQWKKRPQHGEVAAMPSWMESMDTITPGKALGLGLLVSAANPKNLALTLTAVASIMQSGVEGVETVIAVAAFVLIGSTTVAGAVLFSVVAPARSTVTLGTVKRFMAENSAVIMMIVLLLLGAKSLGEGLGSI